MECVNEIQTPPCYFTPVIFYVAATGHTLELREQLKHAFVNVGEQWASSSPFAGG